MENLTEKVYECTLAVEAHMICDLLSQAGISARIEGEFLQSGGGELPLGNLVKVRVDPARAAEAREVIADWEKQQPVEPAAVPVTRTSRFKSPLWFFLGLLVGGTLAFVMVNMHKRFDFSGVDYDGDGRNEIEYFFDGGLPSKTTLDRNGDERVDGRWIFDSQGYEVRFEADDNFDGRFEWQADIENGEITRNVLDADGDGRPEQVWHAVNGVLTGIDYHFASGGRIVKREIFQAGLLSSAEYDDDGDGVFERRVQFDSHSEPIL